MSAATAEQTDGAKPGNTTPVDRHAFNADKRANEREQAPVTIGELVFHRRRKNWQVTRGLRRLLRVQERASIRQERIVKQIRELPADADDDQIDELERQSDELADRSDEAAYEIIALLLKNEAGESPDLDHLKGELDVEDAGDLAATLSSGGETEDPTPATPSS